MQKGNGEYVYAVYDQFRIEGSATNYVLHVSGYAGDAGKHSAFTMSRGILAQKNPEKTPHSSPIRARYGASLLSSQ